MAQIFLSYRRSDSKYATGRISDRLRQKLGEKSVFQDVETVRLGEDFEIRVNNILEHCRVMLVIIGEEWLSVSEEDGSRRLDNPGDLVRREVAAALANKETVVIPVLVDDAVMPRPEQLPEDLKPLATRNAATVAADASFDSQMTALEEVILQQAPELSPTIRYGKVIGPVIVAAVLVVVAVLFYLATRPPADLDEIAWSGVVPHVHSLDFGETRYQALYLRTEGGAETIEGDELKKYELDIQVRAEDGGSTEDLIAAKQVFWDELPEDEAGSKKPNVFLRLVGGKRRSTAYIAVSYKNRTNDVLVSSDESPIAIVPPNELAEAAADELHRIVTGLEDVALSDADIYAMTTDLLEDKNGSNQVNALRQRELDQLKLIRGKATTAMSSFDLAESLESTRHSLSQREESWSGYIELAQQLGRRESPQLTRASTEIDRIEAFKRDTIDSLEAATCGTVANRNCSGQSSCFDTGAKITSWVRLNVAFARGNVVHQLVRAGGETATVLDSSSSPVTVSPSYRTWAELKAPSVAGRYQQRIMYDNVVLASNDVCIGDCEPCN